MGVWDDPALWLARGVHDAAVLAVLGALTFRAVFAPGLMARMERAAATSIGRRLDRIAVLVLLAALGTALWWIVQVSASMTGAGDGKAFAVVLWPVLTETWFGRMMLVRMGLLLGAAVTVAAGRRGTAALLAAGAVAVQPWFAHGAAMEGARGNLIVAAETVHVLAAGLWLGALVPLLVVLRLAPVPVAATASRRFSALGISCVLAIVFSALGLASLLVGSLAALAGTTYGHVVLMKLGLLLGLLCCALANRQVLTPALARRAAAARRLLAFSVLVESLLGLLVVLAAGLLASLPPP